MPVETFRDYVHKTESSARDHGLWTAYHTSDGKAMESEKRAIVWFHHRQEYAQAHTAPSPGKNVDQHPDTLPSSGASSAYVSRNASRKNRSEVCVGILLKRWWLAVVFKSVAPTKRTGFQPRTGSGNGTVQLPS